MQSLLEIKVAIIHNIFRIKEIFRKGNDIKEKGAVSHDRMVHVRAMKIKKYFTN